MSSRIPPLGLVMQVREKRAICRCDVCECKRAPSFIVAGSRWRPICTDCIPSDATNVTRVFEDDHTPPPWEEFGEGSAYQEVDGLFKFGWLLVAMHDPSGRRGLWVRYTHGGPHEALEFMLGPGRRRRIHTYHGQRV